MVENGWSKAMFDDMTYSDVYLQYCIKIEELKKAVERGNR